MRNKKSLLALGCLVIFGVSYLSSCKKDTEETTPDTSVPVVTPTDTCGTPIMSYLAAGHILTYDFSYFSSTFILTHTIKNFGGNQFKTILSSSLINDSVYSKECGGWLYQSPSQTLTANHKYRKSNTVVGDTWSSTNGATTATYVVIAKNVSVTVPAGTFLCDKITYHQTGTSNTDTMYFNNSVGDVKYLGTGFNYSLKTKNY